MRKTTYKLVYFKGEVTKSDMATITSRTFYDASTYASNPEPYPDLLVNTKYPYNAEAKLSQLTDFFITPIGRHFVRNHCAVPEIDPKEYTLTITGEGLKETTFSLGIIHKPCGQKRFREVKNVYIMGKAFLKWLIWTKIVKKGLRRVRNGQNVSKWANIHGKNGPKWTKMDKNGPKWI